MLIKCSENGYIFGMNDKKSGKQGGYANMVGNVPRLTQVIQGNNNTDKSSSTMPETTLYIIFNFGFR